MNAGAKASLTVDLPPSSRTRIDLVTRRAVEPSTKSLTLTPGQTAVLYTPVQ